jgi:hypothetical protein
MNVKIERKIKKICTLGICSFKMLETCLFHYHEDGSKKLNACSLFFLCMVYF